MLNRELAASASNLVAGQYHMIYMAPFCVGHAISTPSIFNRDGFSVCMDPLQRRYEQRLQRSGWAGVDSTAADRITM